MSREGRAKRLDTASELHTLVSLPTPRFKLGKGRNDYMGSQTPNNPFVRLTGPAGPWQVASYESSGVKSAAGSQDTCLVLLRPDGILRVAVIDGVTPAQATPSAVGVDGARYAAGLIRTALTGAAPIEDCLVIANTALYSPDLRSRAQAQATVACADVHPDGRLHIVRGCDCEAWVVRSGGGWDCLFPSAHRAWALTAWDEHLAAHPGLCEDKDALREAEQEVWGRPDAWESLAIGREKEPRLEIADLMPGSWRRLLLASDGFESRRAGALEIDDLIAALSGATLARPYDDATVVIVCAPEGETDLQANDTPGRPS